MSKLGACGLGWGLAYYNENDPFAAAWLRNLIEAGHIADGVVDERSIEEVQPEDLAGFTQCHFFAGIGAWSYALRRAGWSDDRPVWTGSCPCPSFSAAGKGGGFNDPRHLWPCWGRLIGECRPPVVFGEQVKAAIGFGWLDLVQAGLEGEGYAVGKAVLGACSVGAPHIRQRLYFVAESKHPERRTFNSGREDGCHGEDCGRAETHGEPGTCGEVCRLAGAEWLWCRDGKYRPVEPGTFPLVTGTPNRVGRLRGYGNALCAEVAKGFIRAYMEIR